MRENAQKGARGIRKLKRAPARPSFSGLSELRRFFRHCPACGRRFEIRIIKKELESIKERRDEITKAKVVVGPTLALKPVTWSGPPPIVLEEKVPLLIEEKTFNYTYKCKHCGHEWVEVHEEENGHRVRYPQGYPED